MRNPFVIIFCAYVVPATLIVIFVPSVHPQWVVITEAVFIGVLLFAHALRVKSTSKKGWR